MDYRKTIVNGVKVESLIVVRGVVGQGTPDDPVERAIEIYTLDGRFLAASPREKESPSAFKLPEQFGTTQPATGI
jgi:hypothetical protein